MHRRREETHRKGAHARTAATTLLAAGAVIGVWVVGAYMLMSAARGALDGLDVGFDRSIVAAVEPVEVVDDEEPQQANVAGPVTATVEEPAPPAPPANGDRNDCNAIRGTPYRSPQERAFYLNNCTGSNSSTGPASSAPQPSGPARSNCEEIQGTPYRNAQERNFYLANCLGR